MSNWMDDYLKRSAEERERRAKKQAKRKRDSRAELEARVAKWGIEPPSRERTLAIAQTVPLQFQNPFAVLLNRYWAAYMSQWQPMFLPEPRPVVSGVPMIPQGWPDDWRRVLRDLRLRASDAMNFFGICELKHLYHTVEDKLRYFQLADWRTDSMRRGTDAHKALESAERAVAQQYEREGRLVHYVKRGLLHEADLVLVQESQFEGVLFTNDKRQVFMSGHPDRVIGSGLKSPIVIAEAKNGIFGMSERMVLAALAQDLFYGGMGEAYVERPVILTLTDAQKPFDRLEFDFAIAKDMAGFSRAALKNGKAISAVRYDDAARGLTKYLLQRWVDVRLSPERARPPESKEVCDRYKCPFRERGCPAYKNLVSH
ncbi:hypothetical protein HY489_05345 [Candidatus Woesearchaeota archaeon]|nr:hypothetical protein [Candidatus Woesearchaeota archaeon]